MSPTDDHDRTPSAPDRRCYPRGRKAERRRAPGIRQLAALLVSSVGMLCAVQAATPADQAGPRHSPAVAADLAATLPSLPAPHGPEPEESHGWQLPNPYRNLPPERLSAVRVAGASAYGRHCATCHGAADAPMASPEAPQLMRLDSACRRLKDSGRVPRCQSDVDHYFLQSVLEGKLRAGQMHMPAWRGRISQEEIWAIRSYTESLQPPPPRRLPDLPPVSP